MASFPEQMDEYKKQMENGTIKQAYQQLMEYMMGLRTYFTKKYPDFNVSRSIYYGYMDMTYFALIPKSLKKHKLKITIVFIHDTCRFEVWLSAANKTIQKQYWKMIIDSGWNKYRIPPTIKGIDSIIEKNLIENPDFHDLDKLTNQIEQRAINFIADIEHYLSS
jgi:hypothetical protein